MWGSEFDGRYMKRKGQHPRNALTAVKVNATKKPGRYADGNGLYLVVDLSGAKRWMLRAIVQSKRRDIGLGGLSVVSLADARKKAEKLRGIARDGGDPIAERRKERVKIPTFEKAARDVHAENAPSWKNPKHAAQWIKTLEDYVFPVFGSRAIDTIESPDVVTALSPIWLTKPETARRVKQRIGMVLDFAKAKGYRAGDNPVAAATDGLPKQAKDDGHHDALPYKQIPRFIEKLRRSDSGLIPRLAFEFLILTATRTNEAISAKWNEIDLKEKTWTIPAERMKASKEHVVPLCIRCIDILGQVRAVDGGGDYVFPGRVRGKPLSNTVFLMMIRRLNEKGTGHGFRSSFKDWASEETHFANEVSEMALAHAVKDKTEAAYRRGDMLEKRRALMQEWAAFASGDANAA